MRIWLQKKVLIPLIFSPPEFPPVPSSYRAWRCVSWTGFPLFQVPGNLALALPRGRVLPASQAQWLCLCRSLSGQRAGCSPMLWPGSAAPAESNHQPPRVEVQAHSLTGGQPAALHTPDCKFTLARTGQAPPRTALAGMQEQTAAHGGKTTAPPSPGDASTQRWQQQGRRRGG